MIAFEGPLPLSQSSLFKYVRTFYDRLGQEAWSHHGLPTHITCHAALAHSYAALIAAWIDDLQASNRLDTSEPVYILELGAGMGRLGFGICRCYERLRQDRPGIVYVVTDFVAANVDAMHANPGIAGEIAAGRMDSAELDAIHLSPPHLRHAKRVLDPRALKNPIVVVANYVIDSLPTDAFWVKDGVLEEALVRLSSEDGSAPNWAQRNSVDDLGIDVTYAPCRTPRYDTPLVERVLQSYVKLGDCGINLPQAGLRCVDTLQSWSKPDMLLLSGDKAYVDFEEMRGHRDFHLAHHGSVSLMSNYHAFVLAAPLWNGRAWVSPLRDAGVSFLALRCGVGKDRAFGAAFQREIVDLSPTDRHGLVWQVPIDELDVGELLAMVRLSGNDPLALSRIAVVMCARAAHVTMRTKDDLAQAVAHASDLYLHLPFDEKFVRETAQMLAKLEMSAELETFAEAMRRRCGPALDLGGIVAHAQRMHQG